MVFPLIAAGPVVGGIVSAASNVFGGAVSGNADEEGNVGSDHQSVTTGGVPSTFASGAIPPPSIKTATKVKANASMSSEELLSIAVDYLGTINENLKAQAKFDSDAERIKSSSDRESVIENSGNGFLDAMKKKSKADSAPAGLGKTLLMFGGLLALVKALTLSPEDLTKIQNVYNWYKDKYQFFKNLWDKINVTLTPEELSQNKTNIATGAAAGMVTGGIGGAITGAAGAVADNATRMWSKDEETPAPDATKATEKNAAAEVPNSAYDVVFGNGQFGSPENLYNKKLSEMTVDEVLRFQSIMGQNSKKNGKDRKVHTPVGAFQFTKETIEEIGEKVLGDDWRSQKFDKTTQDKLGKYYWDLRRGGNIKKTWESMDNKDYSKTEFEDIKSTIISKEVGAYVGMTPVDESAGLSESTSTPTESAGGSAIDFLKKLPEMLKGITQTDGKYAPMTTPAPSYDKYQSLYDKNIEMENNMITGLKVKNDAKTESMKNMSIPDTLRSINGGSLDVINPNYNLSENNIVSDYLKSFGYSR